MEDLAVSVKLKDDDMSCDNRANHLQTLTNHSCLFYISSFND